MRPYSSLVRPCSAAICGVTLRSVSIIATAEGRSERKFSQQITRSSKSGRRSGHRETCLASPNSIDCLEEDGESQLSVTSLAD